MKRPLLHFALPFVLGVLLSVTLIPETVQLWTAAAILLPGLSLAWLWKKGRTTVLVSVSALVLGILWVFLYSMIYLAPAESLVGKELTAQLELLEYPEEQSYNVRVTARMEGVSGKVMFYGDETLLALSPGDKITAAVKCYSSVHVGGKDIATYTAKGVYLRLYAQGEMTVEQGNEGSLRFLPQRMKRSLQSTVCEVFDENVSGFVLAILTGERDALDDQSESDLEESGLMHLTAVSGLHCSFLMILLGSFLLGNPYLKAWIGYPVLLFYMVMVGGTPSVVRACIMAGFPLMAPVVGGEDDPPTSLSAAALLILLLNPFAAASVSFQLSFAAVTGLLLLTPGMYRYLRGLVTWKNRHAKRIWNGLAGSVSGSLGALFFTVPISAYYFRTVSLVAPLSNLLVFPVMTVVFGASLITAILCMISPVFVPLASPVSYLIKYVLYAAGLTSRIPGHAVRFGALPSVMWLIFVYTLLLICFLSGGGRRKYVLAAVLSLLMLAVVRFLPVETVKDDAMTIVSVDVGQGAATLIHSCGVTALVDCGSHYSQRGSGASVVDTMDNYGWDTVDYLVLTHYHRDHAGGLHELLARTEVGKLLLPWETEEEQSELSREVLALAERYGVSIEYIYDLTMLSLGWGMLTIYPQLTHGEVNEEGLAVLCSTGEFDALLVGDMGMSTEELLLNTYDLPDIEVLFVAHHGSKYSTSYRFLRDLTPEVGVISVGENSYGHPAVETMERMAYFGMELYRTDWQGNILIQVH